MVFQRFPFEPVPPTSFSHTLAPETGVREGRLLFAQRRCAACHEGAELLPAPGHGMPELALDAPVFADFGARFNERFLAHWINDPASIRPHTPMPRVFAGPPDQVDPQAADLAAFLVSLGQRRAEKPPEGDEAVTAGRRALRQPGLHRLPHHAGLRGQR